MDSVDITLDSRLLTARGIKNLVQFCEPKTRIMGNAPRNRKYRSWVQGFVNGKQVALFSDPVYETGFGLLSIHLSQFRFLSDVFALLSILFEHQWLDVVWSPLRRLDYCIDLALPTTTVLNTLIAPRARVIQIFGSKGNMAAQYGRGDRFVRVYPKELPMDRMDFLPDCLCGLTEGELVTGTRIETQTRRKHLPIRCLGDLPKLRELPAYSNLKLIGSEPMPACFQDGQISDRVGHYLFHRERVGASQARRDFNPNGHFDRDIGSKLRMIHDLNLKQILFHRLNKFLDCDIPLPIGPKADTSGDSISFFDNLTESSSIPKGVGCELH